MTARRWASSLRPLIVLGAVMVCPACAPRLMKLPTGPGPAVAAAEADASLTPATAACRGVRTLTAEIAVRGSAAGHRWGGRLLAGVAAPASVRLEAVAPFGPPLFIFVARGDEATLLLPRDDRVLARGRPDAVLEAFAGVPLGAADLELALKGCAPVERPIEARQVGDDWRVITTRASNELFLHRENAAFPWVLVASVRAVGGGDRRWRAEFRDHQGGLPRSIRLTSVTGGGGAEQAFDLQLALSQVEINIPLGPDAFTVQIPRSAEPITLQELRASGPLAPRPR